MREILLLSANDIQGLLTMKDCIEVVKRSFFMKREEISIARTSWHITKPKRGIIAMLGNASREEALAVKIVTWPEEKPRIAPSLLAIIILYDPESGIPLSIMDGTIITGLRTAACSAVASEVLARRDSMRLAVLGSGFQARFHTLSLIHVMHSIREITVFSRNEARRKEFIKFLKQETHATPREAGSVTEAVKGADIVVTATSSAKPVLFKKDISAGTHICAVGMAGEIAPEIFKDAKIVVDDFEQCRKEGKVSVALKRGVIGESEIHAELGDVIREMKSARQTDTEITIFDNTGLAVHDALVARLVYDKAKTLEIGATFDLYANLIHQI